MAEATRPALTVRQRQVLDLIADGKSAVEIGAVLDISPATAKTHIQKVFERYGVSSRAHAVATGFRAGDLR